MKTMNWLVLAGSVLMLPFTGMAQCSNIQHVTLDTTVIGFGATGDTPFEFTFPQFDSNLGTLTEVKLSSQVSLSFHYDIENALPGPKDHQIRLERYDDISSPLLSSPISSSYVSPWRHHNLQGSDGVTGSGDDFMSIPPFYVVNNYTIIDETLYNTADFIGIGNVSFSYATAMFRTTNPATGAIISNDASSDRITFTVDYTYCSNILLASDITSFSASKENGYINLRWATSNELPNHNYELQKSYDGKNFVAITTVPSKEGINGNASYTNDYTPLPNEKDKIYFRIRQVVNGVVKFSPVRMVDLGDAGAPRLDLRLIPNPSHGAFSITMNNTVASDWSIVLLNIAGQVVIRKEAINSTMEKYVINESLSAGVYFVMVTDTRTSQKYVERMVVN